MTLISVLLGLCTACGNSPLLVSLRIFVIAAALGEAGRTALGHDGPGHLVRGLVDHFVAEHDRSACLFAGGVRIRLDNPRRARNRPQMAPGA